MSGTPFVFDARTAKRAEPGGCRNCGQPLPDEPAGAAEQRHCSKRCKRAAYMRRKAGETIVYTPGVCGHCGAEYTERRRSFCSIRCSQTWNRARPFQQFRSRVDWPQELPWLAKYLTKATGRKIAPDDPRLERLALALAEKKQLVVYVNREGKVGAVGKPKQPKGRAA